MGVGNHNEGPILHVYRSCGRVLNHFLARSVSQELQKRGVVDLAKVVTEARGVLQKMTQRYCGGRHERVVDGRSPGFCKDHNDPTGNIGCLHCNGPAEFMEVTMEVYRQLGLLPQEAQQLHLEHLFLCDQIAVMSSNPNNLDGAAREMWRQGVNPRSDRWFTELYDEIIARRLSVRDALCRVSPSPTEDERRGYHDEAKRLLQMSGEEHQLMRFLGELYEMEVSSEASFALSTPPKP